MSTFPVESTKSLTVRRGLLKSKIDEHDFPPKRANIAQVFDIDGHLQLGMTSGERVFKNASHVSVTVVNLTAAAISTRAMLDAMGKSHQFPVDVTATMKVVDPIAYVQAGCPDLRETLRALTVDSVGAASAQFDRSHADRCQAVVLAALERCRTDRPPTLVDAGLTIDRVEARVEIDERTRTEKAAVVERDFLRDTVEARIDLEHHEKQLAAGLGRIRDDADINWFMQHVRSGNLSALEAVKDPERLAEIAEKIREAAKDERNEDREFLREVIQGRYAQAAYPHVKAILDKMFGSLGTGDAVLSDASVGGEQTRSINASSTDDEL